MWPQQVGHLDEPVKEHQTTWLLLKALQPTQLPRQHREAPGDVPGMPRVTCFHLLRLTVRAERSNEDRPPPPPRRLTAAGPGVISAAWQEAVTGPTEGPAAGRPWLCAPVLTLRKLPLPLGCSRDVSSIGELSVRQTRLVREVITTCSLLLGLGDSEDR